MFQLVDVQKQLYDAVANRRKTLLIFVFSTILVVLLDVVLMLTSNENYALELIFTILFTSLYLGFLVFYFSILRKDIVTKLNFYSNVSNATLNEIHVELIDYEKEKKIYNGLEFFVVKAVTKNPLKDDDKFYYLPTKFEFKKGEKKVFKTFGSVVIEIGEEK